MDRAFAKATGERGLDGWLEFMADDVVRSGKPGDTLVVGKDAVRIADARLFADSSTKLVWEPIDSHMFLDGSAGITSGRYKVVRNEKNGESNVVAEGGYVTWWKKQADGKWKVIFDTGCPDSASR
jgi:ketosteroid isomerase-like protein